MEQDRTNEAQAPIQKAYEAVGASIRSLEIREHMAKTLGDTPLAKNLSVPMQLMEEQIKRNTEIFRQAMEVFTPFGAAAQKPEAKKTEAKDIEELKEQLRALQTKIENM